MIHKLTFKIKKQTPSMINVAVHFQVQNIIFLFIFIHYIAPGPVQNINVNINNDNSATVTWRSPLQGGQFISSYNVQVTSTVDGNNFNKTVYSTGILSATFDSLSK